MTEETQGGGINVVGGGLVVGGSISGRDMYAIGLSAVEVIEMLFDQIFVLLESVADDIRPEAEQKALELRDSVELGASHLEAISAALDWFKTNAPDVIPILRSVLRQPVIARPIRDLADSIFS